MKTVEIRSRELFDSGYYCAESVLMAVMENKGIVSDLIPRIATGFCGGMSRNGGLCGALTGGIMALNILYGRKAAYDPKEKSYAAVSDYIRQFGENFGGTRCAEVLRCDISTPEGAAAFKADDLESEICAVVTEKAAGIVMNIAEKLSE